jgi:hypothetical protein
MDEPKNTEGGSDMRKGDIIEYASMNRSDLSLLSSVNKGPPSLKAIIRIGEAVEMLIVSLRCDDRLIKEPLKKFRLVVRFIFDFALFFSPYSTW